jgi:hypothetical protein
MKSMRFKVLFRYLAGPAGPDAGFFAAVQKNRKKGR